MARKEKASLTGESSNHEEPSRHLERPDEVVLDRLFETFQEWNVELDRLAGYGRGLGEVGARLRVLADDV